MLEKIKQILIDQAQVDPDAIVSTAELVADLGLNSLELADLMLTLEEQFNIEVREDAIKKFTHVSDVVEYVENEMAVKR